MALQAYYHDGAFAERMRVSTENVTRLGPIEFAEAPLWSRLGTLLVPFGGLLAIDLKPGETVVVNGATGRFGAAAVEVALGMGAARVVATGRNRSVLAELAGRLGPRVSTAIMRQEDEADRAAIVAAAAGPIDCVLDILPPAASIGQVRAAVLSVRPNGRVVLRGGVGMAGGAGLGLPYPWLMRNNITLRGQWMYPRKAASRMIAMIRAGLVDLTRSAIATFDLNTINEGVAHATTFAGPFEATVIQPSPFVTI